MRRLSVLLTIFLMAACSQPTPEELASLAAKGYYDHLIHGEYEKFLEGVDMPSYAETLSSKESSGYREQLLDSYRMYMSLQEKAHRGIREVRIVRASTDSLADYTSVFLVLCFGDSTNEEIVVPMVEREGRWRMK